MHLSQVGSSVSPILKRCPFRWQCPVSSPTIHLNWSLTGTNALTLNRYYFADKLHLHYSLRNCVNVRKLTVNAVN
jgi:hypothetical protein